MSGSDEVHACRGDDECVGEESIKTELLALKSDSRRCSCVAGREDRLVLLLSLFRFLVLWLFGLLLKLGTAAAVTADGTLRVLPGVRCSARLAGGITYSSSRSPKGETDWSIP